MEVKNIGETEYRYRPIARRVLCVAVIHHEFRYWRCFINAVPAKSFDKEFMKVVKDGEALEEAIAKVIFDVDENYNYRY